MNLYKIKCLHAAPKDIHKSIACLLLANNDESVYEWLKSEPTIQEQKVYLSYQYNEDDETVFDVYDNDYNIIGTETFKEKIIRIKGEYNDEDYDYSDAYYGITLYGWDLIKENVQTDYSELIELGIVFKAS